MSHPPDPEMRRPRARQRHGAKFAKLPWEKQPRRYIISDDLQALAIALSPLWFAILLALYVRGLR